MAIKSLAVTPAKCTGCHRCELWCSLVKWGKQEPSSALIFVVRGKRGVDTPVVCTQCGLCSLVCPSEALVRNGRTGAIEVDAARCTGCGECVAVCPHGVIWAASDTGVAVKCDLCGGEPACVTHCPHGVLECVDVQEVLWRRRQGWARGNLAGVH